VFRGKSLRKDLRIWISFIAEKACLPLKNLSLHQILSIKFMSVPKFLLSVQGDLAVKYLKI